MKKVKCVVWDLDNTIWDGTILEDSNVTLKDGILDVIKSLDERGILQSISSKNDYDFAMKKLEELNIAEYFLFPQINWNQKSDAIRDIAKLLNIGIDTFAFVDDQVVEREEVKFNIPEVLVIDANNYKEICDMEEFIPKFITEDSKNRRIMYKNDIVRKSDEKTFKGTSEEFLETLGMKLNVSNVCIEDLQRAYELTVRTNQLNSTGYTYSYDELTEFIDSQNHIFNIASLKDKYGDYGKIGLVLTENQEDKYMIKLLLMSCRVMTKGIGKAIIINLIKKAQNDGKELYAEFKETEKNRIMYITYKFMGFEEFENDGNGKIIFKYTGNKDVSYPKYLEMV